MFESWWHTTAIMAILPVLAVLVRAHRYSSQLRGLALPPGPRRLPIIGNLLNMPREGSPRIFASWQRIYGDVLYASVFGREFVILNTAEAAFELFDHRGLAYSDRPTSVMAGDLVGKRRAILFLPYGNDLKRHRRLLRPVLEPRCPTELYATHAEETFTLVRMILAKPADFVNHIHRHVGAIALKTAYGYQVTTGATQDPFIALGVDVAEITRVSSQPGRWLVDIFPWLQHLPSWFPGAGFKRWAEEASRTLDEFADAPYNFVKRAQADGTLRRSFVTETLDNIEAETGRAATVADEEFLKWTAAGIHSGSSTSIVLGELFMIYMVSFPEVQQAAQKELDSVVGRERFATMDDRRDLPYIEALIKEIYRFRPITPLIPHCTLVDDEYRGFRIPAGSWVMANVWAMMHNANEFAEPERFWPERYLQGGCKADPRTYIFGFGRRRCPGAISGDASLYFLVTYLLSAFSFHPAADAAGNLKLPSLSLLDGIISRPKPFECKIVPREGVSVLLGDSE